MGIAGAVSVALLSLHFLAGRRISVRAELGPLAYLPWPYVAAALVPMLVWFVPPAVRMLARGSFRVHRMLKGASGFYFQLPAPGPPRFAKTLLMALAPFSINLLVVAQILYLRTIFNPSSVKTLVALPAFAALSGLSTSLPPGVWLLDALSLRYVDSKAGAIVPVSELYSRSLGPAGAVAGLSSFIILLHTASYSYEICLLFLAMWTAILFPPILAATSFYRIVVEPRVLPKLQTWFGQEAIGTAGTLEEALARPKAGSPGPEPAR
jgi:hypothetical protein